MIKRETPRVMRETPRYFQYADKEEFGDEKFTFRLPGKTELDKVYTEQFLADSKAVTELATEIRDNPREMSDEEAAILGKAGKFQFIMAALVGQCWWHETMDLSAEYEGSVYDYGEAVAEDLDSTYDFDMGFIEKISAHILVLMNKRTKRAKEVNDRVNFTQLKRKGKKKR